MIDHFLNERAALVRLLVEDDGLEIDALQKARDLDLYLVVAPMHDENLALEGRLLFGLGLLRIGAAILRQAFLK